MDTTTRHIIDTPESEVDYTLDSSFTWAIAD